MPIERVRATVDAWAALAIWWGDAKDQAEAEERCGGKAGSEAKLLELSGMPAELCSKFVMFDTGWEWVSVDLPRPGVPPEERKAIRESDGRADHSNLPPEEAERRKRNNEASRRSREKKRLAMMGSPGTSTKETPNANSEEPRVGVSGSQDTPGPG